MNTCILIKNISCTYIISHEHDYMENPIHMMSYTCWYVNTIMIIVEQSSVNPTSKISNEHNVKYPVEKSNI